MSATITVAAPLMIAGIVMNMRFLGCSLDHEGLLAAPTPYSTAVLPTAGLVSFWRLNEASGTRAADSKGMNVGTYVGGATLGQPGLAHTDSNNTAAEFDGATGYVSVAYVTPLNPPAFTVEALVNPTTIDTGYHAVVSSRDIDASAAHDTFGYILYLHGGNFEAWVGTGTASFSPPVVVTAGATAGGGPYYVAMTYDGTTLTLYVNPTDPPASPLPSSSDAPDQVNWATVTYRPAPANELRIGAGANEQAPLYFFPGVIQDVAVYNEALPGDTIVTHFVEAVLG